MVVQFVVIPRNHRFPEQGNATTYLKIDYWNDYSFVTMFDVRVFDQNGVGVDLGAVKIGFVGQTVHEKTYETIGERFDRLPEKCFSVGQDVEYYRKSYSDLSRELRESLLERLNDVVFDANNYERATGEDVFRVSLLRSVSTSTIVGQYRRVLDGGAPLSDFNFGFSRGQTDTTAGIDINFAVKANSFPSTNIHAIIGRNGVGKTSLLNEMITAVARPDETVSMFYSENFLGKQRLGHEYFSSLVSVSFSAFDPFSPPKEQPDPEKGTKYYYIGLKDDANTDGVSLKSVTRLHKECIDSLVECFSDRDKCERWRRAISTLESDENFALMRLGYLSELKGLRFKITAGKIVGRMSSGHAIVLLTLSRLVAKVEEKTLVLLDEPESHLHPPLLAAFTRALSQLLHDRNGVAIVATHSPVVLQELPKSCAWILTRSRLSMQAAPPRIETFGENVGVLTREVFGLEVVKSGFHSLLEADVSAGDSYEDIVFKYSGQIGLEARGILRAMLAERDAKVRQA